MVDAWNFLRGAVGFLETLLKLLNPFYTGVVYDCCGATLRTDSFLNGFFRVGIVADLLN